MTTAASLIYAAIDTTLVYETANFRARHMDGTLALAGTGNAELRSAGAGADPGGPVAEAGPGPDESRTKWSDGGGIEGSNGIQDEGRDKAVGGRLPTPLGSLP